MKFKFISIDSKDKKLFIICLGGKVLCSSLLLSLTLILSGCINLPPEEDPQTEDPDTVCQYPDSAKKASYDEFSVTIKSQDANNMIHAGEKICFDIFYVGDPVRKLWVELVLENAEDASITRDKFYSESVSTFRIQFGRCRAFDEEILKTTGQYKVYLVAHLSPTLRCNPEWTVESPKVDISLSPTLSELKVLSPSESVAYGDTLALELEASGIWEGIQLNLEDMSGNPIVANDTIIDYELGQERAQIDWRIFSEALERIGTHTIRILATYGEVELRSDPIDISVSHTIDELRVYAVSDTGGSSYISPTDSNDIQMSNYSGLDMSVFGTQLKGKSISLNGASPIVAASDTVLFSLPFQQSDFENDIGFRVYDITAHSGGQILSQSVRAQRWGITSCQWLDSNRTPLASKAPMADGSQVYIRAYTWGFSENTAVKAAIWEDDSGRSIFFGRGDDHITDLSGSVSADSVLIPWTVKWDQEFLFASEVYFELTIKDQTLGSSGIKVR